eukprot:14250942-Alexandrium_andersonii.AAC.1
MPAGHSRGGEVPALVRQASGMGIESLRGRSHVHSGFVRAFASTARRCARTGAHVQTPVHVCSPVRVLAPA